MCAYERASACVCVGRVHADALQRSNECKCMVVIGETGIIDGNATEKKKNGCSRLEVMVQKKKRPLILLTALTPLQRACENGWMDGWLFSHTEQTLRFARFYTDTV